MRLLAVVAVLVMTGCASNQPDRVDMAVELQKDYCNTYSLTSRFALLSLLDDHRPMHGDEFLCGMDVKEWMSE